MKKKRAYLVFTLCFVLAGLFFYSCSEFFLPKRVEIRGGVDLPARLGIANIGSALSNTIEKAFSTNAEPDEPQTKVYTADYDGQTLQMSCIYLPLEVTENINPDHFLKTVNRQLNDGLSEEPRKLYLEALDTGTGSVDIDLTDDDNLINLPVVSLERLARYVISIDFDECVGRFGDTFDSGIGLNFYFDTVVPGLVMTVKCDALSIDDTKPLKAGNNVFGNNRALTGNNALHIAGDSGTKILIFEVTLHSNNPGNPNTLTISSTGNWGDPLVVYDGEMSFFQNWTKATIDLAAAIRAEDGKPGSLPRSSGEQRYFDLSALGAYFDGFTFEGIEARIYMISSPVSGLDPILRLDAHYGDDKTENLYRDLFSTDIEPLALDERFVEDNSYIREHLPGMDDNIPEFDLDKDVVAGIFSQMPDNLFFTYQLESDHYVDIYPDTMVNDPDAPESSKIFAAIMILLPMHLKAIRDDSTITISSLFGGFDDLFGRKEPGEIFPSMDVRSIKMSVDFSETMFLGGHLFIDGSKEEDPLLFAPDGVKLDKKKIAVNFTAEQLEVVKESIIKPHIWFKFKENDEILVPKVLGIMKIGFSMDGIINTGEFLE